MTLPISQAKGNLAPLSGCMEVLYVLDVLYLSQFGCIFDRGFCRICILLRHCAAGCMDVLDISRAPTCKYIGCIALRRDS